METFQKEVYVYAWCAAHETYLVASPEINENRQVIFGELATCPMSQSFNCQENGSWTFKIVTES